MRTTVNAVISLILFFGCSKTSDDSSVETGDTQAPPPECLEDAQCTDTQICDEETCVAGDRNNSVEEAKSILWEMDNLGTLETAGDVDYYAFVASGGEFVRVSTEPLVEGTAMNTVVTLYDPNGKVHHVEDEHAAGSVSTYDTVLYAYLHMGGTWIAAVEDVEGYASDESRYSLVVTETGGFTRETDSMEQPGATVEATRASTYWAVGVHLGEAEDTDWIEVELPWENCPVYLAGSQTVVGTDANPTVELYDTEGNRLGRKEGLGPDGTAMYPEVNGKTLYIAASDSHGGGGENHWFFVFLSIGEGGYSYTQEEEPNDSAEEATELDTTWTTDDNGTPYGYATGWGTLNWEDDVDAFYVTVEQDQYLHIWGTSDALGSLLDSEVEVIGPDGSLQSAAEGDDSFGDISNLGPLDAGNYTVRVRHENVDGAGPGWWYRFTAYQTGYTVNE